MKLATSKKKLIQESVAWLSGPQPFELFETCQEMNDYIKSRAKNPLFAQVKIAPW
jgi:hypothetical protein